MRAFYRSLDDIEEFVLDTVADSTSVDEIKTMLRFLSLQTLAVNNVHIPSMDIFTSGDVPELRLETLVLGGLTLVDSARLVSFVKSLGPRDGAASSLSRSLESVNIAEIDGSDLDGIEDEIRLAVNDMAAVPALKKELRSNKTLRFVNFVGDFAELPVMPVKDPEYRARKSRVLAPIFIRQGALEKARIAALLSRLQYGARANARRVDSSIVRLIIQFSSPHVQRKVRV